MKDSLKKTAEQLDLWMAVPEPEDFDDETFGMVSLAHGELRAVVNFLEENEQVLNELVDFLESPLDEFCAEEKYAAKTEAHVEMTEYLKEKLPMFLKLLRGLQ